MSLSLLRCSIPSPGGAGARRTLPFQVLAVFSGVWCEFHRLCLSVTKGKQELDEMAAEV